MQGELMARQPGPAKVCASPGPRLPNWEVVRSGVARRSIEAIVEIMDLQERWTGFDLGEGHVRRAVLELYPRNGRAPSLPELSDATGITPKALRRHLAALAARDVVVLDPSDGTLSGAYPFTERDSGIRLRLFGRALNAMCAIDALGVGSMYRADVRVDASCIQCGEPLGIDVGHEGSTIEASSPVNPVVWSGLRYERCASDSLCRVLAFFCGDDHLSAWRSEQTQTEGYRLSLDEALQVGRAIFGDLLTPMPCGLPADSTGDSNE